MAANSSQLKRFAKWADRNWWAIPIIFAVIIFGVQLVWSMASEAPIGLANAELQVRQQINSSLSSSSGSLLGFTIAAVAILATFGQREVSNTSVAPNEKRLARARTIVNGSLLMAALLLLLVVLLCSTTMLATDTNDPAPEIWIAINMTGACGAILGLILGGIGLALTVVERNRANS